MSEAYAVELIGESYGPPNLSLKSGAYAVVNGQGISTEHVYRYASETEKRWAFVACNEKANALNAQEEAKP